MGISDTVASMSLIPEKMLSISPALAATIGLEEAVLLTALNELMCYSAPELNKGYEWLNVDAQQLQKHLPFWSIPDLQRISASLRDKGILLIASAPLHESNELRFAFNETSLFSSPQNTAFTKNIENTKQEPEHRKGAKYLPSQWKPEEETLRQLGQYNIPNEFIDDQLPEFITYWSERNEPQFSWGSKFIKHTLRLWREHQAQETKLSQQTKMHSNWLPTDDAINILIQQSGINGNFVEDAIPEFVLYWSERGDASNTWNSRFIMHVKRQWARFTATMEHNFEPSLIPADWLPSEELFEVLTLANISHEFARRLAPEFVLYWRESGQAHNSWNTKFLQHVKREWSRQQSGTSQVTTNGQQRSNRSNSTRNNSLIDELSDRSWAST
jgi:hypothetical protein